MKARSTSTTHVTIGVIFGILTLFVAGLLTTTRALVNEEGVVTDGGSLSGA